jgi:hypothetical protein
MQASTHAFHDTQVWEEACLVIDPVDATRAFYTEPGTDARLSAQGVLYVIATSTLAASSTFGSLYLEFDVEFRAPSLDTDIGAVNTGTLDIAWSAFSPTITTPILAWNISGPTATPSMSLTGSVALNRYIMFGVLSDVISGTPPLWCTQSVPSGSFSVGGGYFLFGRDALNTTAQTSYAIATSFEGITSALDYDTTTSGTGHDQLCYSNAGPHTATIRFTIRAILWADI